MAYKIKCKEDGSEFYFKEKEDIKKWAYVFIDHWCNLHFTAPEYVEEKDVPENQIKYMNQSPSLRAEDDLTWGFSLEKRLGIGLTPSQEQFVNALFERFGGEK